MTAGIALGPSLLWGCPRSFRLYLLPGIDKRAHGFEPAWAAALYFVVDLDVDLKRVLKQHATVVLITNFSLALRLVLGIGLATGSFPAACS